MEHLRSVKPLSGSKKPANCELYAVGGAAPSAGFSIDPQMISIRLTIREPAISNSLR
jgi:hypothetical protein